MNQPNILIVEDEELMRSILRQLLESEGYKVFTADSAETALEIFTTEDIAVTLTDIKMRGMDGLELLDQIKTIDEEAIVIIMTAYSSVDSAISALRKGAYDYVTKPFVNEDLLQTVKNALRTERAFQGKPRFAARAGQAITAFPKSSAPRKACRQFFGWWKKFPTRTSNILIQGESGTGKELIARADSSSLAARQQTVYRR